MEKQFFFFKLIPPRSTFPADITPAEKDIMMQHREYCTAHLNEGRLLIFGPVIDPAGVFGMAVLQVADEAEARQMADADLSIQAGLNRYELHLMRLGGSRAQS